MNPDPDEHVHPGEEALAWGEGISVKKREKKPQSRYWAISEQARKIFPGESQCKMFCGGKNCKYCTPDIWTEKEMVIKGLYSHWVTDNILAMARMSDVNIDKFKFLEQFQSLGIRTVINLQEPGEHAHCGMGVGPGGFSYEPQRLMAEQMYFYNFVMKDYGVAPMPTLLDTVKVMQFAVSVGKIAVHCHAGLGRTGLVIACYLIYNNRVGARKAVQYVRSRRPGSIQTKQQVSTCHEFEQYLKVYFIVFTSKIADAHPVTFSCFLVRQRQLLHGYEARKLKHIPKIVYVCCERLLELCGKGNALNSLRNTPIDPVPVDLVSLPDGISPRPALDPIIHRNGHQNLRQTKSLGLSENFLRDRSHLNPKNKTISKMREVGIRESLSSSSIDNLEQEEKDFHSSRPELSRNLRSLDISAGVRTKGTARRKSGVDEVDIQSSANGERFEGSKDFLRSSGSADGINFQYDQSTKEEYEQVRRQSAREVRRAEEEDVKLHRERSSMTGSDRIPPVFMTPKEMLMAATVLEHPRDVSDKIEDYKDKLNKSDSGWQTLAAEDDPEVISGLMSAWLDHLNEPVLRYQDIQSITANFSSLERAFLRLETSTKYFLEYVVVVLSKVDLESSPAQHAMLELVLSNLCQKRLGLGFVNWPCEDQESSKLDVKPDYAEPLFQLFHKMLIMEMRKEL